MQLESAQPGAGLRPKCSQNRPAVGPNRRSAVIVTVALIFERAGATSTGLAIAASITGLPGRNGRGGITIAVSTDLMPTTGS